MAGYAACLIFEGGPASAKMPASYEKEKSIKKSLAGFVHL